MEVISFVPFNKGILILITFNISEPIFGRIAGWYPLCSLVLGSLLQFRGLSAVFFLFFFPSLDYVFEEEGSWNIDGFG